MGRLAYNSHKNLPRLSKSLFPHKTNPERHRSGPPILVQAAGQNAPDTQPLSGARAGRDNDRRHRGARTNRPPRRVIHAKFRIIPLPPPRVRVGGIRETRLFSNDRSRAQQRKAEPEETGGTSFSGGDFCSRRERRGEGGSVTEREGERDRGGGHKGTSPRALFRRSGGNAAESVAQVSPIVR